MKSKAKNKNLILKICTIVLSVFSFVSMAFTFFGYKWSSTTAGVTTSEVANGTLQDWLDLLATDIDNLWAWQTARVFMIITLVAVGIIAVLAVLQLFIKNKTLNTVIKFVGIAGIVLALLFLVFFVIGSFVLSGETTVAFTKLQELYYPHVGAVLVGVSGIAASVCGLLLGKKTK